MKTIDINCDLGEGSGYDEQLMPLITSCSIACGGHYGNIDTMQAAVKLAKEHGVKIGAHPSYPDKENFGRVSMSMDALVLKAELKSQILKLKDIAEFYDYPITHIKPHGALYNDANCNAETAQLIVELLDELNLNIPIFTAPYSQAENIYLGKIDMIFEGFSDRRYHADYSLVSRNHPDAVIVDSKKVMNHVHEMVLKNRVVALSGEEIKIQVNTICMHSDSQNAVKNLHGIREMLASSKVKIKAYD